MESCVQNADSVSIWDYLEAVTMLGYGRLTEMHSGGSNG